MDNETRIQLAQIRSDMDHGFTVFASLFVFVMQIGFAFLEAGLERSKNVTNILLKTVGNSLVTATCFWMVGFALSDPGDSQNGFIGGGHFLLIGSHDNIATLWFLNWNFVSLTTIIVSGSLAGRAYFHSFLMFSAFMSIWVYPVVAYWIWSPTGWLYPGGIYCPFGIGVVDYAGGTVVHVVGGVSGFLGAILTGPRLNRFTINWDGPRRGKLSLSKSLWTTLGVFLIWVGWYGFNMGSGERISDGYSYLNGVILVNNTLAASAGALVPLILNKLIRKNWDISITLSGVLSALSANTASCAFIPFWASWITGAISGCSSYGMSHLCTKLHIDDPLDAFAIHTVGGITGLLSTALFAEQARIEIIYGIKDHYGLFMGGGALLLGIQLLGIVVVTAWTVFWSGLFFVITLRFKLLRVTEDMERLGLDVSHLEMTSVQRDLFKGSGDSTPN